MNDYASAERLRQMRLAKNLTREALAVQAGVSGSTVMKAEQGHRVGYGSLIRMLAILDPEARVTDLIRR